jgi:hypothetical protein
VARLAVLACLGLLRASEDIEDRHAIGIVTHHFVAHPDGAARLSVPGAGNLRNAASTSPSVLAVHGCMSSCSLGKSQKNDTAKSVSPAQKMSIDWESSLPLHLLALLHLPTLRNWHLALSLAHVQ